VKIGRGSIIADHVDIRTANHYYDGPELNALPFDEKVIIKPVEIGQNVWIASNVLILPGVKIGDGAVIAGGSVVTKNVENFEVVGGNPARHIKYRDKSRYNSLYEENKIFALNYDTKGRNFIKIKE